MLSFVAGIVNICRVLSIPTLTTNVTGLFADLGIEISQLLFYRDKGESANLSRSIYLRLTIIVCFFFGGVIGGFLYEKLQLQALLMAAASLVIAFLYENIRFTFHYYRRKLQVKGPPTKFLTEISFTYDLNHNGLDACVLLLSSKKVI